MGWWDTWFYRFRDLALVVCGLGLLWHETVYAPEPRDLIVLAGLGLAGLPIPLRLDQKRGGND